ncbi:MAG: hypothetical protein AAF483_25005 [Planctomycetota bacterium]
MDFLRLFADTNAELAESENMIWIRINASADWHLIEKSPGKHYFLVDGNKLLRCGKTVVEAKLPELDWQPLRQNLRYDFPVAAMAGSKGYVVPFHLELERIDGLECSANAGLYELSTLGDWLASAPEVRIRTLSYCLLSHRNEESEECKKALVIGEPLPSVDCLLLRRCERILLPLGFHWKPAIEAELIQAAFQVPEDSLLFWRSSQEWSFLREELIRPLSRGSFRCLEQTLLER